MNQKNWKQRFTDEFGIHFSASELQFALAFIEEEIGEAYKRGKSYRDAIEGSIPQSMIDQQVVLAEAEGYKKGYIDGQLAKNEAKPVNKSDCCNANYMFARTDEGDGYFQCQSCLRPCNETCPYRNGVIHLTK